MNATSLINGNAETTRTKPLEWRFHFFVFTIVCIIHNTVIVKF